MTNGALSTLVQLGVPEAVQLTKSLLTNPTIVSTDPPFAFSLEVETYDKQGQAEVSQRPVIVPGSGVKEFLNDNVSPQPITWNLSGYIMGDPMTEKVCFFTPAVYFNVDMLWKAFQMGSRIMFKDMNQQPFPNCVIESLSTPFEKDCQNKRPFSMTIKEIKVIETSFADLTEVEKNAIPSGEDIEKSTKMTQEKNTTEFYDLLDRFRK
ncbi:MAG: hypothetical protein J6Q48_04680 [Bacteroidaceae bacterium]|nr:hypothetical protein [Bacteroidaceae bacterium]